MTSHGRSPPSPAEPRTDPPGFMPAVEAHLRVQAARELLSYGLAGHVEMALAVTAAVRLLTLAQRFLDEAA